MAFVPKLAAVLVAIPGPVVAAYFIIILALLFMFGLKILQNETLDYRNSLVVGLAFWLGIAFELDWVFPEYFQGALSELIGNGMTVGGLTVIALTLFRELTGPRRQRLRVALTVDAYPKIDAYLAELGARKRWHAELVERIRAVGEEALLLLTENQAEGVERRLLLIARAEGDAAVLEFIAATDATNLEDRMAVLGQPAAGGLTEQEVSLRLLQHYASSVRHYQYHDTDVVVVRVESAQA